MEQTRRSPWRFGVPVVCLLAGLLLAATHGVSGGDEIRRSDAPRLVDLVREAQQSVDRLTAQRDSLVTTVDNHHGGSPGADAALAAITNRSNKLAVDAGLDPMRGPGLVVTLNDAQRDAEGRFPRDASPDDLVVHQQDIEAVLNALWSAGAEGIQMQDQRIIGTSAPRCVGNTLLLNGRTYSPPYVITAIGNASHAGGSRGGTTRHALQAICGAVRAGLLRATARPGRPGGAYRAGPDEVRQAGRPHRVLTASQPRFTDQAIAHAPGSPSPQSQRDL
jgi:uncharacterized protein YlxW (UPF0749 family)